MSQAIEGAQGERNRFVRGFLSFASATFLSRILGFIRDMVVAMFYGASHAADAFFIAFSIPSLLRRLFAEGSLSASFVSVFSKTVANEGEVRAREVFQRVFTLLGTTLLAITLAGVLLAPLLVWVIVPGFRETPGKYELTVLLTQIMFPYLLFIGLATVVMGTLNTHGKFFIASLTPLILNVAMISACAIGAYWYNNSIVALAVGVATGGALQLIMQLPSLWGKNYRIRLRWAPQDPAVKRIITLMIPGIFGLAVAQINTTIDGIVASFLAAGSVSFLYYANRLVQFPLGVFGIAISTAILPGLSRASGSNDTLGLNDLLRQGNHLIFFITLPCVIGLLIVGYEILEMLLVRGEFTLDNAWNTYLALATYSLGLLAFSLTKMTASVFYSFEESRTPVKAGVVAMVINAVLNVAFMYPFGHAGLALATSLASWANFWYLWHALHRKRSEITVRFFDREIGKITLLCGLLGIVLLATRYVLSHFTIPATGQVALQIPLAVIFYSAGAKLLRLHSYRFLLDNMRRKKDTKRVNADHGE